MDETDQHSDIKLGYEDLLSLGVTDEWIWGNGTATIVYAQAFGEGQVFIFRFSLDSNKPESIPSRIVNRYHDRTAPPSASFETRYEMREALWGLVAGVWPRIGREPFATRPDVIIDLLGPLEWTITHDKLFDDYLVSLQPLKVMCQNLPMEVVKFERLERIGRISGRQNSTLVALDGQNFVFKGIDFRTFLHTYENGAIQCEVDVFKRATELVAGFDKGICVQQPPRILVTVTKPSTMDPVVCGVLYPHYSRGTVDDAIATANAGGMRIPLHVKVKWCFQMTAALYYTHHVAGTYHMNVTPASFIINDSEDLILVDWDQDYAAPYTAAPEVDGTWDAAVTAIGNPGEPPPVQYTKYEGPIRSNMPETSRRGTQRMEWNSFKQWQRDCPRACELAEVFSLGRTMWMLLRQVSEADLDDVESRLEVPMDWTDSGDIPMVIRNRIPYCVSPDPNGRPDLQRILGFWKRGAQQLGGMGR